MFEKKKYEKALQAVDEQMAQDPINPDNFLRALVDAQTQGTIVNRNNPALVFKELREKAEMVINIIGESNLAFSSRLHHIKSSYAVFEQSLSDPSNIEQTDLTKKETSRGKGV